MWINSARMPVITNPAIYCSLQHGRGREISNVSTQSSVWHAGRTLVALESLIWILTRANRRQEDLHHVGTNQWEWERTAAPAAFPHLLLLSRDLLVKYWFSRCIFILTWNCRPHGKFGPESSERKPYILCLLYSIAFALNVHYSEIMVNVSCWWIPRCLWQPVSAANVTDWVRTAY